MAYKGRLLSVDSYMNVQLGSACEKIEDEFSDPLGEMMIRFFLIWCFDVMKVFDGCVLGSFFRCNNILYIQEVA